MDAERRVHRRMLLTTETRVVEKPGEEKEQCPLIGVIRGAGNIGRRWGARLGWPDPAICLSAVTISTSFYHF
jgi:hypothetical protein